MTKSVLFGTQAGTVSGSEVDVKNYFNKVERFQGTRAEDDIEEYLTRVKRMEDSRTSDDFTFTADIEWNPLFKVDSQTRVQMIQNEANALTTLIGSFAVTPDEAREILSEDFVGIDLDDLSEGQMDILDRINLTRSGQGTQAVRSENEYTEGPQSTAAASEGGREGGREMGQQQASENPTGDASQRHSPTDVGSDPAQDSIADEIERLVEMHDDGVLSDDEFETAKERLL
jgi:hypothetical protein